MPDDPVATPKVFMSYSWTSQDHKDWVIALAERLVGDGVDVVLDEWDFKEGHDKFAFMERMVNDATVTKVLAVCDETYAVKANDRKGGVGTESQIITKEIYENVDQEKFIALARECDGEGKPYLPVFFQNRKYLDFSHEDVIEESYDKLVRILFGKPERKKPQLGRPPTHIFTDSVTHVKVAGKLERLKDAVKRQKPHAHAALGEYLDLFAESLDDFRIAYKQKSEVPFDEEVLASVKSFSPYRDSFIDLVLFVGNYMNEEESYDRIFDFLETILVFKCPVPEAGGYFDVSPDNYRVILYELFVYLVAALIKAKRYSAARRFIQGEYHYPDSRANTGYAQDGAGAFYSHVKSLEEYRNKRLKLNMHSVVADMIREGASHAKVSFADFCQADFLIFFLGCLPDSGDRPHWNPLCIGFQSRVNAPFEIFAKATSPRGFKAVRDLLAVKDPTDLYNKVTRGLKRINETQQYNRWQFMFVSLQHSLNLDALRRQAESQR